MSLKIAIVPLAGVAILILALSQPSQAQSLACPQYPSVQHIGVGPGQFSSESGVAFAATEPPVNGGTISIATPSRVWAIEHIDPTMLIGLQIQPYYGEWYYVHPASIPPGQQVRFWLLSAQDGQQAHVFDALTGTSFFDGDLAAAAEISFTPTATTVLGVHVSGQHTSDISYLIRSFCVETVPGTVPPTAEPTFTEPPPLVVVTPTPGPVFVPQVYGG
jgi:hypothetical protein